MSERVAAGLRMGLPSPFKPCSCQRCKTCKAQAKKKNRVAPFHLRPKKPGVRIDFRFAVHDWELAKKGCKYNRKRVNHKHSLLDFPGEVLRTIYGYIGDNSSSICLSLTCKKLCEQFEISISKPEMARLWNNTSGPWKMQLMLQLARGWIPKHELKLCFSCWKFRPYGPDSTPYFLKFKYERTCKKGQDEWMKNWEVLEWKKCWPMPSNRIRCPLCVLDDQSLLTTSKHYKNEAIYGPWGGN